MPELTDGIFHFSLDLAFSSMIEGKNEEMSTTELSGGARIHYIFQSIFVKSLEVCVVGMNFFEMYFLLYYLFQSFQNLDDIVFRH